MEFIAANWDTIALVLSNVVALFAKSPMTKYQ
jgi:hypothetical protein